MLLQVFSEHLLHVFGGGAIVAGLIFGLIVLLLFLDKRRRKTHPKHRGRNIRRQSKVMKKRPKKKKGVQK
jgi:hypothetical protein